MAAGVLMLIVGLLFIGGPLLAPENAHIPMLAKIIIMIVGLVIAILGVILIIVTKLYVKASANVAFVRTGLGGPATILDGGAIVIPIFHQVIMVQLHTFSMTVERRGHDALITADKLRADVTAEFFVQVPPKPEKIKDAARSLKDSQGKSMEDTVQALVEPKLINGLRAVAAKFTLDDLNVKREEFALEVAAAVRADIDKNGFDLEVVTISSLDQTPAGSLQEDNFFDVQGLKKLAEVVNENKIQANQFKRTAEQKIAEQDAETVEIVAAQSLRSAQAEAKKNADIAMAESEQQRTSAVFAATQKLETEKAQLETEQKIGEAAAEKTKQIEVAQVLAAQAAATAGVLRDQAVEVASRAKEVAIAEAEKSRAAAQALQLKAEQEREKEKQQVATVQEVAAAEREKQVKVITAQRDAEVRKTNENIQADITAYKQVTEAEGRQKAADNEAKAITVRATAEKDAQVLRADGETAVQMVPVTVKAKDVEVEAKRQKEVEGARVDVLTRELAVQDQHQEVAIGLQKALAAIGAEKDVRIAFAQALGQALGSWDTKIYGTPEMFNSVMNMFQKGQGIQGLVTGLTEGGEANPVNGLIAGAGEMLGKVLPGGKPEGKFIEVTPEMMAMARTLTAQNPAAKAMIQSLAPGLLDDEAESAAVSAEEEKEDQPAKPRKVNK